MPMSMTLKAVAALAGSWSVYKKKALNGGLLPNLRWLKDNAY
jgi:hypothetical protein